jgi:membrane protein YqaA with SNARE-associated domain
LHAHWRAFAIALVLCAVAGGVIVLFAPDLAGLYLLGIYSIPTNSIVPLPHEPGILYAARFYHPLGVALAGALGSAVACFADYALVEAALRHPRIARARRARLFRWAVKWMTRYPFLIVLLFAATPLPVVVVRLIAPASGYPVGRYVVAQLLGRFPRFLALAYLGHAFHIPGWILIAMFVALLATVLIGSGGDDDDEGPDEDAFELPDLTDPEHPRPVLITPARDA